MQAFNFGIRNSATPSVDEIQSRYVPSSIYSGPGPAEESPLPPQPQQQYYQNGQRRPSQASHYGQFEQRYDPQPPPSRNSASLNLNDPVVMHLLMETAIMDSKDFEILSFEELEHLKRERAFLRNKVEGAKRQHALEKKMHDAAQLMNRLTPADAEHDSKKKRSSFLGRRSSNVALADDQLNTSSDKVEQLAQEVKALELRLQEVEKRILHHTAGILQFTHKGLKKNVRKNELPRSPESMASGPRSISGRDGGSDFDERSLYQVPDYVHDMHSAAASRSSRRITKEIQPIEDVAVRLHTLNAQLHDMIQQVVLTEHFEPPPEPTDEGLQGRVGAQIQAHLTYMAQGLEALGSAQSNMHTMPIPAESTEQLHSLTSKLHGMLERTNSVSKSPIADQDQAHGDDLSSQLTYSAAVLERLTQRVDTLLDQKDILTRQIQQQRELNSKSDAQRDAHIRDLTEELEDAKKLQVVSEKEMQQSNDQIELLMEQLDQAKQNEQLMERQRGMADSDALNAERTARQESEAGLMKELEAKQHALTELQADHAKIEHDFELKSQYHVQKLNEANSATEQAEINLAQKSGELEALNIEMQKLGSQIIELQTANVARAELEQEVQRRDQELGAINTEMREMESQVVQLRSELTMAKAELDASYGSRAQRAADVSMNPEIKKQIDELGAKNAELEQQLDVLTLAHETKGAGSAELQNKVNALQKELKDTIEDYEVMTKASIEFEKEREQMEAAIDQMRERCHGLEVQISEDQVKWLGVKNTLPPETTSTMVLKNEFKKMMRDSRAESIKTIRVSLERCFLQHNVLICFVQAEQEERKRLEGMIRTLRKESAQSTPSKPLTRAGTAPAVPGTPSKTHE